MPLLLKSLYFASNILAAGRATRPPKCLSIREAKRLIQNSKQSYSFNNSINY